MHSIRRANMDDSDFMMAIDLVNEGISVDNPYLTASPEEWKERREWIATFADQSLNSGETEIDTCPKYAFIIHDDETKRRLGLIMFLLRDMNDPTFHYWEVYNKFDRAVFPSDGRVCEIFQLWVSPEQRGRRLGSQLMRKAEEVALQNNVGMIYTHTEATNDHVVELCRKLGYQVIRTGELGGIARVSQVRYLPLRGDSMLT